MRRALPFVAGFVVGLAIAGALLAYGLTHRHRAQAQADPVSSTALVPSPTAITPVDAPSASTSPRRRGAWPSAVARDYDMDSAAGNRALESVMRHAAKMLKAGRSREAVLRWISTAFAAIARVHGEVHDTLVCEAFAVELDRWLEAAGLDPIDACSEFDW
jgi:hypothetical protein